MKTVWTVFQLIFSITCGFLGWFLGGVDGALLALILFVILDYFTGVICAIINKKLSSNIGAIGILKKVLIFIMVGMAQIVDKLIVERALLRTVVIFFYLSNEGISILENLSILGIPIPKKLKDTLDQLNGHNDEKHQ